MDSTSANGGARVVTRVTDIAACLKHIYVFCYIDVLRTGADRACRNDSASALLIGVTPQSPHYCCWADGWVEVLLTFFDGGGGGSSMRVASRAEWTHSSAPLSSRSSRPPSVGGGRSKGLAAPHHRAKGLVGAHARTQARGLMRHCAVMFCLALLIRSSSGTFVGGGGELPCKGLQTARR